MNCHYCPAIAYSLHGRPKEHLQGCTIRERLGRTAAPVSGGCAFARGLPFLFLPHTSPYLLGSALCFNRASTLYSVISQRATTVTQTSNSILSRPYQTHHCLPSKLVSSAKQQHQLPHALATAHNPRDPPIDSTSSSTMPTPDETAFPPSPPIDIPARSQFASCPPEEDREAREESDDDGEETTAEAESDDHAIAQEPTPEPDAIAAASQHSRAQSKERANEDLTTSVRTPSPVASHDAVAAESEAQAQASSSSDAHVSFPPQYLDFAPNKQRVRVSWPV